MWIYCRKLNRKNKERCPRYHSFLSILPVSHMFPARNMERKDLLLVPEDFTGLRDCLLGNLTFRRKAPAPPCRVAVSALDSSACFHSKSVPDQHQEASLSLSATKPTYTRAHSLHLWMEAGKP